MPTKNVTITYEFTPSEIIDAILDHTGIIGEIETTWQITIENQKGDIFAERPSVPQFNGIKITIRADR